MKISLLILLLAPSLLAQGTITFQVEATGGGTLPPNNSLNTAGGFFQLSGDMFSGEISFTSTSSGGTLLAIRDATGGLIFVADRIESEDVGGPFAFAYGFWDARQLSDSQTSELMSGNWYLVMSNNQFPNGEVRGQLQVVPEPPMVAIFGVGVFATFAIRKARFSLTKPSKLPTCHHPHPLL